MQKQQQEGTIKIKQQLLAKVLSTQITKFRRERVKPSFEDET